MAEAAMQAVLPSQGLSGAKASRRLRTWPRWGLACPRPPASRCANWRLKLSTAQVQQAG